MAKKKKRNLDTKSPLEAEHEVRLPSWEVFVEECLDGKAFLFVKGGKPDKIFEVCTIAGAKRAIELLLKVGITNFVLFSVEGYNQATLLMATGMLIKDLPDARIFVEDRIGYIDGVFPRISSGKPDKIELKKFIVEHLMRKKDIDKP